MATIDLDKARAARAETQGETHDLVLGGETYQLPAELPYEWAEASALGNIRVALAALLGEEEAARLFKAALSIKDLEEMNDQIAVIYGVGESGEASASRSSSKRTSKNSRQPSPSTTPS